MGSTSPSASHDPTNDDEACIHAMELLNGFVVSMTVKAAIELGLIDDLLAAGGRAVTPEELVAARPWPRPAEAAAAADRMLRFLASHGVVRCTTEVGPDGKARRSYAAAPVCKWLAARKDNNSGQGSMAPLAMMNMNKAFMETWYYMTDAVAEGVTPTEKAYGMPLLEHLSSDEASNALFNQAMASHSEIVTNKLLELYRCFDGVDVLVDVGGGTGATLQMITARHKNLRGVSYDLPHVIAQAPIVEGVEHVGGSMFDYIPSGNAILLKWILHLWRDEECVKILKNCHRALPANGKVIIIELVLPASPEPTPAAKGAFNLDVMMLNRLAGAKELEIADLAAEAGFSGGCRATYIFACAWALEFTK